MLKYSKKKKKLEIPCGLGNVNCLEDSSIRYQEKQIDSSTIAQVVTYDPDYNALSQVFVNPYTLEQQAALIEDNGHFVFRPINRDAISSVEVDVSIAKSVEQEKSLSVTENGTYTLTPDPGYTGISRATIDVSVDSGITPEGNFTLNDLETHDVSTYATANVNPVGIIPGNIRKDVEILGVTGSFEGGELTEETVDSSTVSQTVTPSEGYYGMSSVTVNPYTLESKSDSITENGSYTYTPQTADGLDSVTVDVSVDTVNNQSKTVNSSTSYQTVTPDAGYTGLDSVTVNPYNLDHKTVNSSTNVQTVTSSVDGLSQVTVNPYTLESKSDSITENGTYTYTPDEANALSSVYIDVSVDTVNNQSKTVNSSTSSQEITYDSGYTGLEKVTIDPYTLESKSDSITENGTYTYTPQSADGLDSVTVDVSVDTVNNQSKTVNSSTSYQTVTPDAGYTGLDSVTVNPYNLDHKTVNSSTNVQTVTSSVDGLSQVTVNPYTVESKSDSITVNGSYTYTPDEANALSSVSIDVNVPGEEINNQTKTVDSSSVSQIVTYDSGYTGLESVTVNPYDLETLTPGTATEEEIFIGETAWVDGEQLTGEFDYPLVNSDIDDILGQSVIQYQAKTADASTESQVISADAGYLGLSQVTVNPYSLESKSDSVTENGTYTYTPDDAEGLGSVTVTVNVPGEEIINQTKTVNSSTSSQEITYDSGYTGLEKVTVNPYSLESKSDSITENGTYTYTPQSADGLDSVTVTVNVPGEEIINQTKTVDSSSVSQIVTYDAGYTGLESVTVNPYDLETLTPGTATEEEIFLGKTAWVDGEQLTGEFDYDLVDGDIDDLLGDSELLYQVKTADSSTASQTVRPDAGYLGLTQVTIDPIIAEDVTCDPSTHEQTVTASTAGNLLNSVTVSAVDNTIDANITAGNIRENVTILGVTGTLKPAPVTGINYLTFTAMQRGSTVMLSTTGTAPSLDLEISTDGGTTWSDYTVGDNITLSEIGDSVKFRGENQTTASSTSNYNQFVMTGRIAASGSVITLLDPTDTLRDLTGRDFALGFLFHSCSSLVTPPELPATVISPSCYRYMFGYCSNLLTPPELPATEMKSLCYQNIFRECTSLMLAPELPATTLVNSCYSAMFRGCTSLITAPELPVTTLANACYNNMFYGCTSLRYVPAIAATALETLSCEGLFRNCSSLDYIKVNFTGWTPEGATSNWVSGVASSGTFVCPSNLPVTRGVNYIPSGWTIQTF